MQIEEESEPLASEHSQQPLQVPGQGGDNQQSASQQPQVLAGREENQPPAIPLQPSKEKQPLIQSKLQNGSSSESLILEEQNNSDEEFNSFINNLIISDKDSDRYWLSVKDEEEYK